MAQSVSYRVTDQISHAHHDTLSLMAAADIFFQLLARAKGNLHGMPVVLGGLQSVGKAHGCRVRIKMLCSLRVTLQRNTLLWKFDCQERLLLQASQFIRGASQNDSGARG